MSKLAQNKKQEEEYWRRVAGWYASGDTGVSSETIMSVLSGTEMRGFFRPNVPHDPSDFGRCHRLLERFPEFRERLSEVAIKYKEWAPFVERWDEMTYLYLRDHKSGRSHELFRLMSGMLGMVKNFANGTSSRAALEMVALQGDGLVPLYANFRQTLRKEPVNQFLSGLGERAGVVLVMPKKMWSEVKNSDEAGVSVYPKTFSQVRGDKKEHFVLIASPFPLRLQVGDTLVKIDAPHLATLKTWNPPAEKEASKARATLKLKR